MKALRSTRMVVLGVAVFVVGAGLVFVALRSQGDSPASASSDTAATSDTAARPDVSAQGGVVPAPAVPSVVPPKGMEAVAVELSGAPGLAGFAKPGDRLNVYATVKSARRPLAAPFAKLLVSGVQVMDVRGVTEGSTGRATYLLALSRRDAERVIFVAKFESLWFTLAGPNQKSGATPGRGYPNTF